jgi:hypothetical protein
LVSDISLNNSWLAGFFDAEGGFYAQIGRCGLRKPQNDPLLVPFESKMRLRLKAYLDQKSEKEVLEQISKLFERPELTVRNQQLKYYRIELSSKKSISRIVDYFSKHKLRSKKHIVYAMWKKLAHLYIHNQHLEALTPKKFKFFRKRVEKIKFQNACFKRDKSVLVAKSTL